MFIEDLDPKFSIKVVNRCASSQWFVIMFDIVFLMGVSIKSVIDFAFGITWKVEFKSKGK